MDDDALAAELCDMLRQQRAMVQRTGTGYPVPLSVEAKRERRRLFVAHADRLAELLEDAEWPSATRVGDEAARGALLVAQHADTQLHVQRLALARLRAAVERGEAARSELALLEDRVAVNSGELQRYGTQVADVVDGRPVLWPCEDPAHLDERRIQVGLEPLAAHLDRFL